MSNDETAINLIDGHPRERLRTFREHARLWVECLACGAQWSIDDAHAEQVSDGDGYCEENQHD